MTKPESDRYSIMTTKEKIDTEIIHKQAWDYFQLHSTQRLTTFNFYLVIASVLTAGLVSTFQKDFIFPTAGIPLGGLLSFFSFIFWALDRRNSQLIKSAEAALIFFEEQSGFKAAVSEGPHITNIFSRDEFLASRNRKKKSIIFWRNHYSYSACFRLVFLSFGLAGIIGAVAALIHK